jgi:multisubunit Na+/H+ antiporter MnhB subunit
MMKKLQAIAAAVLVSAGLGVVAFSPVSYAACSSAADCVNDGLDATGGQGSNTSVGDIVSTVVKVLLFIIGAVSVIMIILGGIRYTISQGDQSQVTSAKNTILYSIIGLIVAILAYALVNFVVTSFVQQ